MNTPPPPAPTPPSPLTRERISALILTVNTRAADDALGKLVVDDLVSSLQRLIALEQQLSHRSADARDASLRPHAKWLRQVADRLQKQQRDYEIANTCEEAADAIDAALQGGGGGE